MKNWSDKFVLVLGLGETGLSMLRYLGAQGARLRAADSRSAPAGLPEAAKYVAAQQIFCGAFTDALFDGIDAIAISPGVPLADPVVARAVARGIPVVGDIELFAQHLKQDSCISNPKSQILNPVSKVLAITGSNGKTTVTSMVAHLCQHAGKDAVAAGNISPAVLDVMMQRGERQPDVWVLELSSFQLETTDSLNAAAATVLNISEDHLDRYDGMN
ncbi:MAG: Mur ligase family protein, partial [Gallionella sp.]